MLVKSPFLRLKKKVGPTVDLKNARKDLVAPRLKQKKRVNTGKKHSVTMTERLGSEFWS